MARKKGMYSNETTVIKTTNKRKPKKGETIRIGEKVTVQNNGKVGSQTIISLDTFNGDLFF